MNWILSFLRDLFPVIILAFYALYLRLRFMAVRINVCYGHF